MRPGDRHRQGTVKIIDFGSTKIAGVEAIATPIERLTLLGTRHYTAPEYLLGEPCGTRSDLFSLAVIIYELLTGTCPSASTMTKPPFAASNTPRRASGHSIICRCGSTGRWKKRW